MTAHSDKEGAAPTFKRGYGDHPLWSFLDHGPDGTGEPLSFLLRPRRIEHATDHIAVARDALAQLPGDQAGRRRGRRVLIRADAAGCTHAFLDWVCSKRLGYSVGFILPSDFETVLARIPIQAWSPAYDADGGIRDGAHVADVTGLLDLHRWPPGMRSSRRRRGPALFLSARLTSGR